jgi:hypothetical protein
MTHPDAQRAFEEKYQRSAQDPASADMLSIWNDAWDAALSQRPAGPASFEQYWTEDGRNLCKSPLGSFEARMHKRTWDAATERAAKAALEKAYDAMFHINGCKVTRFDAQTAIAKLKEDATAIRSSGRGEG